MNEREMNIKREKPKVGDVLYLRTEYSGNGSLDLYSVRVNKVGKKFFSVNISFGPAKNGRFLIENWQHESSPHHKLYASVEESKNGLQRARALEELRNFKNYYALSTKKLLKILEIIKSEEVEL